jgi:type II secretory pathway component PulF
LVLLSYALAVGTFLQAKVFPLLEDVGAELGGPHGGTSLWKAVMGCVESLAAHAAALAKLCDESLGFVFGRAEQGLFDGGASLSLPVPLLILALLAVPIVMLVLSRLLRRPAAFVFSRLPVIHHAAFQARWGHALKIISLLLERGFPLDRALESAAGSDTDRATRRVLGRMSEGTRAGLTLSEVLDRERRKVPRSARSAVIFGERTGRLPELLSRLSHIYQLHAERTLRVALDITFPLAIVGCGLLISTINVRFFTLMTNMVDGIMGGM